MFSIIHWSEGASTIVQHTDSSTEVCAWKTGASIGFSATKCFRCFANYGIHLEKRINLSNNEDKGDVRVLLLALSSLMRRLICFLEMYTYTKWPKSTPRHTHSGTRSSTSRVIDIFNGELCSIEMHALENSQHVPIEVRPTVSVVSVRFSDALWTESKHKGSSAVSNYLRGSYCFVVR